MMMAIKTASVFHDYVCQSGSVFGAKPVIMSLNLGQILLNLNLTKICNGQKHHVFQCVNDKFQIELKSGSQSRNLAATICFYSQSTPIPDWGSSPHTTYGANLLGFAPTWSGYPRARLSPTTPKRRPRHDP